MLRHGQHPVTDTSVFGFVVIDIRTIYLFFSILVLIFHAEQFISYCLGDYKVIKEGLGLDAIKGVFVKTAGFVVYGQNTCVTYNFRCEEVDRYL